MPPPSIATSQRNHRNRLPSIGVTYSIEPVSLDGARSYQSTALGPSQAMSLVLEPRYFPSRSKLPCDTIDHDCSVDKYNDEMRDRFLKSYTPDIPNLLSHVVQVAIFKNGADDISNLITTADPTRPLLNSQSDTCRAITIAFTDIMTKVMHDKYGPSEHPSMYFVNPSKWTEILDETDPHKYISGLDKQQGGSTARDALSEGMSGRYLSQQTKLKVYVKGDGDTIWALEPDGRRTVRDARFTPGEENETVTFHDMSGAGPVIYGGDQARLLLDMGPEEMFDTLLDDAEKWGKRDTEEWTA